MSDQASTDISASPWMPASTSRRAGFGTSFPRRSSAHKADRNAMVVSFSGHAPGQKRLNSFGEPFERCDMLETTANSSANSFHSPSNAPSLSSRFPVSVDSSPSVATTPGPANEQQVLSQHIMQLSDNMATCVHQNELVISLLERLVALSENMAARHDSAGDSKAITSPSLPPRAQLASGGSLTTAAASSKADPSYISQQYSTNMADSDTTSLSTMDNAPVNLGISPGVATETQHASETQGMLSYPRYPETAPMATPRSSLYNMASGSTFLRSESAEFSTFAAAISANEQTNVAPLTCYTSMSGMPASLFVTDNGQQRYLLRRASLRNSSISQRDASDIASVTSIDSMQCLSDDAQQQKKRKRAELEDITDTDKAIKPAADDTNLGDKDVVGPWQHWQVPRQHPSSVFERLPRSKHRTLREVRAEIKASSSRPSGVVGRIPLKQYLEVSGPDECRAVRRLGRQLYMAWLEPNTRIGKQDSARLSACINRIEHTFPVLADCEEHWKARQVMLQVIDNAIDEHKSSQRRKTTTSKASANGAPSRRRGRPKGTTAAAMAQRRQEQNLPYYYEPDSKGNGTDADENTDSSDSETEP